MNDDHSKITGGLFHSRSQEKRLTAQVPEIAALKARLSRYETAMREALRILGPAWRYKDAAAILCAALSDQPAVNSTAFTRGDGDRALDCLIKNMRTTSAEQPAEEPAESKLEAVRKLADRALLRDEATGTDKHSDDYTEGYQDAQEFFYHDILAILDAQPSTPEEGARETQR